MQLQKACRRKAKIRMCLQSPSGGGKTYTALILAYGLCGTWDKIAVIDSENRSADLYSHLGSYYTLPLEAPFTPESYIQALLVCEQAGMEVVIMDSITPEWEYILEVHAGMAGNSFTNWSKCTPRHNEFVQAIIHSQVHIIATMRTKQDYVLVEKQGKQVPEKMGFKAIQKDGMDYEFTLCFDLNIKHYASASKDRTGLFEGKPDFIPTSETGRLIKEWCLQGIDEPAEPVMTLEILTDKVRKCNSTDELTALFNAYPSYQVVLKNEFTARKQQIQQPNNIVNQTNPQQNGTTNSYQPN